MKLITQSSSVYLQIERSLIFIFFKSLGDFIRSIYCAVILIKQAMDKQDEMETLLRDLNASRPQNKGKKQSKKTVNNA